MLPRIALASLLLTVTVWGCTGGANNGSLTHDPAVPTAGASTEPGEAAPKGESFYAVFNTSKGDVIVEVNPGWAPLGAARFRELVEDKFYDGCAFFRVVNGFMAQTGVNSDKELADKWMNADIADDPARHSNERGTVTFAMGGPNTRTTQIFFSYKDNSYLDGMGFSPFAEVISGMDVLDSLNGEYGDMPSQGGNGPDPSMIVSSGEEYLKSRFPNLDYIHQVQLYDTEDAARAGVSATAEAATGETPTETPPGDEPAAETPAEPADQ